VDDAEVRQFLQDAVAAGAALVERRFRDGIDAGELPSDFPVAARASQGLDLSRGLTVRAQMGAPREAVGEFESQLRDRKYVSQVATRYGLAFSLLRAKDMAAARREMDAIGALKVSSPMISGLAAEIAGNSGDLTAAQTIYRDALQRFPQSRSLVYGYAESLYAGKQYDQALLFLDSQLQINFSDFKLYGLQAKTYAAIGKHLQQLRSQAEFYYLQGQLGQAVEQLQFAQKEIDGNFYEQSVVDARLRELRQLQVEEEKQKKNGG